MDCLLISICSASGQLYIFYTISKFGPVTFVIMMTVRQVIITLHTSLRSYNVHLHVSKTIVYFILVGFGYTAVLFTLSSSCDGNRHNWHIISIWFSIFTNILQ